MYKSEIRTHFGSIINPFVEDQDAEVQEEENHKDELRNEFTKDVDCPFKVNVIP